MITRMEEGESLTVTENILLPLIARDMSYSDAQERTTDTLRRLGVDTIGDHLMTRPAFFGQYLDYC